LYAGCYIIILEKTILERIIFFQLISDQPRRGPEVQQVVTSRFRRAKPRASAEAFHPEGWPSELGEAAAASLTLAGFP
jgi:hypothetical protein